MKKTLSIMFCCFILIIGCRKEKQAISNSEKSVFKKAKELASYFNGALNGTDVFIYDLNGQLSTATYSKNVHSFEYIGSDVMKVTSKVKATGEIAWVQTTKLNSKGAITEIVKHNPAGVLIDAYYYSYNADGYMISYKYVAPFYNNDVQERFFVIQNGNVISAKSYQNGGHLQNYVFEYDPSEISHVPHTPDYYWMSETLYGKPNKNPVKVQKVFKAADGKLSFHAIYSRVYNADSNTLDESIQYPIAGTNGSRHYKFL